MPALLYEYLEIRMTLRKGRGVFCTKALPADFLVEEAPVIVMPETDRTKINQTLLHDYIFEWHAGRQRGCAMALGYVPLYNHAAPSNCEYEMDYEAQTIRVYTIRPVAEGEELTINYNGDYDNDAEVWFEKV